MRNSAQATLNARLSDTTFTLGSHEFRFERVGSNPVVSQALLELNGKAIAI